MTSNMDRASNRAHRNAHRRKALELIGFDSVKELAAAAGVDQSILSRICSGQIGITDVKAGKLITAIWERNQADGWTYRKATEIFADFIYYLQCRFGVDKDNRVQNEDMERWYRNYEAAAEENTTNSSSNHPFTITSSSLLDDRLEDIRDLALPDPGW
ncbi:hypothetical protein IQ254_30270 [Nodosilinea sp. LEGE 07088]|uniref:helix-turn-helix domain-containing protein n=1 Tax=Nodosilinea sp. LEGE 07088 TaxID=2777968 RepID=UPI00187FEC0D|nr:helix-turn-helix transcriptional regulator [Nodosilinea sp. LEGE 07088]MBE9141429.1 hypothetical protein [Nodosilinea sp. LEGE 07088]